jgi:hypothetical protein
LNSKITLFGGFMFTKLFVKDAGERAVKTFVQALLALILVGGAFNAFNFDWGNALEISASAAVVSVLTSVVSGTKRDALSPASAVSASPTDTY